MVVISYHPGVGDMGGIKRMGAAPEISAGYTRTAKKKERTL